MCNSKVKRFELVELTVPGSSTGRINFQSVPQLRNQSNQQITIKSIEVYDASIYAKSQVNNSVAGMPVAEVAKAVLVLYVNGEESVRMVPLARLMPVNVAGSSSNYQKLEFEDLGNVDLDKSYVQFNQASNSTIYVIPFGISYLRMTN